MKDVAVVLGLNELVPVGRRAPRGCDWWRLERFAKMREGLTSRVRSHPGLRPLANLRFEVSRLLPAVSSRPDVATTRWALERKLLPHPGHQLGPGNPGGVVRAGLLIRVTAAPRRATVVPIPTGRGLALLADVGAQKRGRSSFRGRERLATEQRAEPRNELRPLFLRRTRSVSAARLAGVIGRAGRNAGGVSHATSAAAGTKTPSVT